MTRNRSLPRALLRHSAGAVVVAVAAALLAVVGVDEAVAGTASAGFFSPASGRLVDTRTAGGAWAAGSWHTIAAGKRLGVPASGVTALGVTLTVVGSTKSGYVSALAASAPRQHTTSALNWNAGETVSNSAIVATDGDGAFQVWVSSATQMLIDVQGYFTAGGGGSTPGGFVPAPNGGTRIFDSRVVGTASGQLGSGQTLTVSGATAADGVPSTTTAVFANITVINHTAHPGYLTPWPAGDNRPRTSLNFTASGQTALGSAVGINSAGQFSLYVGSGSGPIDVIVDIQGYYTGASTRGAFTAQSARVYDSRPTTRLQSGSLTKVKVAGLGGIPSVTNGLAAESVNVELVSHNPTDSGYLRLWGTNQAEPNTSNLNVDGGRVRSNLVTVVPGSDDSIWIRYAGGGSASVDVVLDAEGWYASSSVADRPGAPRSVSASAAANTATVSFLPPSSDGGAPITSYTVIAAPGGKTVSGTGSPVVFPGLADATPYSFTVTATNSAGTGPSSELSNPVTGHGAAPCHSASLSLASTGSGGAGGTDYRRYSLTNTGPSSCTLRGYPGVAIVDAHGTVVQHAAVPGSTGTAAPRPVTTVSLTPKAKAYFLLTSINVVPISDCPTAFHGTRLRVYPPGTTAALYLPDARPFCDLGVGPVTATP